MKKLFFVLVLFGQVVFAMDQEEDPYHKNSDPQFESAQKHFAVIEDQVQINWHILDVGCGTGRMSYQMAQQVPEGCVVGFDKDEDRILTAIAKLKTEYANVKNLGFTQGKAEKAKLKNNKVDLITCFSVLHFMEYEKQKKAMKHMAHNLKLGGMLLLTCLEKHIHSYEKPLLITAKEFGCSEQEDEPESYDHTIESLIRLAENCGLSDKVSSHVSSFQFNSEGEFAGFLSGFLFTIKPFTDIKKEQQDAFLKKAISRCLEKVPKQDGKIIYSGVPLLRLIATKNV